MLSSAQRVYKRQSALRRGRATLMPALLGTVLLALAVTPAPALTPEERLDDPALEARARDLSAELRCVVCQNQSIDDSNAPLAQDLRAIVRERLLAGDSNDETLDYVVERYGDYVLLRPPVQSNTMLLWGGPAAVMLIGVLVVALAFGRKRAVAEGPDPLTPEERQRIDILLNRDTDSTETR